MMLSDRVLRHEPPNHPTDVSDDELLGRLHLDAVGVLRAAALDISLRSCHCTHTTNPNLLQASNEFDNIFMELSTENYKEKSKAHISDLFMRRNMRKNILLIILVW